MEKSETKDRVQKKIEEKIAGFPICEYAFIRPEEIPFSEKVRYICRTECPRYGKSWSCPPAVGAVEECRKRWENRMNPFTGTVERKIGNTWYLLETVCDGNEPLTHKVKRLIFSDKEALCS